ncbi:MAG: D-alanine--D-alanine ligase [Ignavibacteriaceae bacterium]|nr:D-alanine--D-alanine ligase [Ignavibacteriaceae bacterium]
MKENAKILICYNAPVNIFSVYNGKKNDDSAKANDLSEKNFLNELSKVEESLSKSFKEVKSLAVDRDVQKTINNINSFNPDVIYNFVESVEGISTYESSMAGLFELLGYEITGCSSITLGNCLHKARAKAILKSREILTPEYRTLKKTKRFTEKEIKLRYPLILKLMNEDASIGISEFSVVKNYSELRKQFSFLVETYSQDVILEEYIQGRELNVAILGGRVLPISEISFTGLPEEFPNIVTYDGKWTEGSVYYNHTKPVVPAPLGERIKKKIQITAIASYDALNCRDYARIDIRLGNDGVPYVVEVNPNPDISSDSGFARAAAADRINYDNLLYTIANFALIRKKKNDSQAKAG